MGASGLPCAGLAAAVVAAALLLPPQSHAADEGFGRLDPTFGDGGVAVTATTLQGEAQQDGARAVVVQEDGRVVIAGTTAGGGSSGMLLARLLSDGSADPTFSGDGVARVEAQQRYWHANDVATDPGGGYFAVGLGSEGGLGDPPVLAMTRVKDNGALDFSFGAAGRVSAQFGNGTVAQSLAVQPDGRPIVGGSVTAGDGRKAGFVARFTRTGQVDPTFGAGGGNLIPTGPVNAVWLQPDGKTLAVGDSLRNGFVSVVRLTRDGLPDPGFGDVGVVDIPAGDRALAVGVRHVAAQGSNPERILVGVGGSAADGTGALVHALRPDGSIDASYGSAGIGAAEFPEFRARAVEFDRDGAAVAVGTVGADIPSLRLAAARLGTSGQVDTGFADSGLFRLATPVRSNAGGAAFSSAGSVYLAGETGAAAIDAITVRLTAPAGQAAPAPGDGGAPAPVEPGAPGAANPAAPSATTEVRVKAVSQRGRKVRFRVVRAPADSVLQRRFARLKRTGKLQAYSGWQSVRGKDRTIVLKVSKRRPGLSVQVRAIPSSGAVATAQSVWLVREKSRRSDCRRVLPRKIAYRQDGRAVMRLDRPSAGCTRWWIKGVGKGRIGRGQRTVTTPQLPESRTVAMTLGSVRVWLRRN